jgi:hypothetical protein
MGPTIVANKSRRWLRPHTWLAPDKKFYVTVNLSTMGLVPILDSYEYF